MNEALAADSGADGDGTLAAALGTELARRGIELDAAQRTAASRLSKLHDDLMAFRRARLSPFRRWINPPPPPRGVYLWGGVGRGKSFLMDVFYAAVPLRRKTRLHFHAFMRGVHDELGTLKNEVDPLATVAARIARRHRLVCFDEFHVSDVADAMILGRLLEGLFSRGVVLVMTSNYRPEDLYPDGLQRHRLLPTIELLNRWLDVIQVDGGIDYRLRALEQAPNVYVRPRGGADAELDALFERMRPGPDEDPRLRVEGRTITARRVAGSVAWFDFASLCEGPRSQLDYLDLACRFAVVIVSDIPQLTPDMGNEARRFTWLVDVFYDHRVKLLMSSAVSPEDLYPQGANRRDFSRTISRLVEMRTRDYMALPRRAGVARLTATSPGDDGSSVVTGAGAN